MTNDPDIQHEASAGGGDPPLPTLEEAVAQCAAHWATVAWTSPTTVRVQAYGGRPALGVDFREAVTRAARQEKKEGGYL